MYPHIFFVKWTPSTFIYFWMQYNSKWFHVLGALRHLSFLQRNNTAVIIKWADLMASNFAQDLFPFSFFKASIVWTLKRTKSMGDITHNLWKLWRLYPLHLYVYTHPCYPSSTKAMYNDSTQKTSQRSLLQNILLSRNILIVIPFSSVVLFSWWKVHVTENFGKGSE